MYTTLSETAAAPADIWFVEDSEHASPVFCSVLAAQGYQVRVWRSAYSALVEAEGAQLSCRLLLTDCQRQGVTSLALIAALRAKGYHGPVIMLAVQVNATQRQHMAELHIDKVMLKPVPDHDLLEVVDQVLGHRNQQAAPFRSVQPKLQSL